MEESRMRCTWMYLDVHPWEEESKFLQQRKHYDKCGQKPFRPTHSQIKGLSFIRRNNGVIVWHCVTLCDIVWYCVLLKNVTKTKESRMKKDSSGESTLPSFNVLLIYHGTWYMYPFICFLITLSPESNEISTDSLPPTDYNWAKK